MMSGVMNVSRFIVLHYEPVILLPNGTIRSRILKILIVKLEGNKDKKFRPAMATIFMSRGDLQYSIHVYSFVYDCPNKGK